MRLSKFADSYAISAMVYVLVGGTCACIEWGSFYVLLGRTDVRVAALTGFLIATLANCALSRLVAFHSVRRAWQEAALVFGVSTIGLCLQLRNIRTRLSHRLSSDGRQDSGHGYCLRNQLWSPPVSGFFSRSTVWPTVQLRSGQKLSCAAM
jgi:hypothetical protein